MPLSEKQKHSIRTLLGEELSSQEIAAQVGVSPSQVAAVKAHETMGTYSDLDLVSAEAEVANAIQAKFGLERDLQLALRRNIQQLEPELLIADGGAEQTVASGRIDITARDDRGACVVIELKAGTADRDAVGQILSYMGDLLDRETQVRGILIAQDFALSAIAAARSLPNVRLVSYGFQFTFKTVGVAR